VDPETAQIDAARDVGAELGGTPHRHLRRRPYPGRSHPALPGTAQRRPACPEHRLKVKCGHGLNTGTSNRLKAGGVRRVLHRPQHHGPGHPGGSRAGRPGDGGAD